MDKADTPSTPHLFVLKVGDNKCRFHMFSTKKITKSEEIFFLLSCVRLPGRLTSGETAVLLGFAEHDISSLIAAKMLKPLGAPAPNAPKYFAAVDVMACATDPLWLCKATRTIGQYWKNKNATKSALLSATTPVQANISNRAENKLQPNNRK